MLRNVVEECKKIKVLIYVYKNIYVLRMSVWCDDCGPQSSLEHSLDCKKGGLVTQRHNKVHDSLGDIASLVYQDVLREPVVREDNEPRGNVTMIADLSIRGLWWPQTEGLLGYSCCRHWCLV